MNDAAELMALRLKEARKYLGLSQEYVAQQLDIPRTAISLIESNKRKVGSDELFHLSKIYQRPLTYFTGEDSSKEAEEQISLLARSYQELSEEDQSELVKFAQFLASRSKAGK